MDEKDPTYEVQIDGYEHTWFYRQPGGCIEIGQQTTKDDAQDIIHICDDQVEYFFQQLRDWLGFKE